MNDRQEQAPVRQAHRQRLPNVSLPAPTTPPAVTEPSGKTAITQDAMQGSEPPFRPENQKSASPLFSTSAPPSKPSSASGTQFPSSDAKYLNNPPPTYPALSLRLNEAGKVVVRVLVGKNGLALEGSVGHSSGYDRLDQAALKAVLQWRYVPGKIDGQARDMWFDVPITFKPPN